MLTYFIGMTPTKIINVSRVGQDRNVTKVYKSNQKYNRFYPKDDSSDGLAITYPMCQFVDRHSVKGHACASNYQCEVVDYYKQVPDSATSMANVVDQWLFCHEVTDSSCTMDQNWNES